MSTPALSSATFVPPVEMISQPNCFNSWANSTIPALSETLISARFVIFSPFKTNFRLSLFSLNTQTLQNFWIELVFMVMNASFKTVNGIIS